MEPTDLTIEVLKGIRSSVDELRAEVRTELKAVRTEMKTELNAVRADLRAELQETREELSRHIVESEIRTATAIAELAGTVRDMTSVLRAQHDLRPRLERCEHDIDELKRVVGTR
jgi:DNA anti-recombination protein RmuC